MHITSIINIPLWDKAKWTGTAFGFFPDLNIPFVGPVFKDEKAAKKIFEEWQKHIGKTDAKEQIRVSLIESSRDGSDPSYVVHVGTNVEALNTTARNDSESLFLMTSRCNRMEPASTSPNLQAFKDWIATFGRYILIPCVFKSDGVEPFFEFGIEKRDVSFRYRDEITDSTDPDIIAVREKIDIIFPRKDDEEKAIPAEELTPERVTSVLASFEAELVAGRINEPLDEMIVGRLADIERGPDGKVVFDSVDPILFTIAEKSLEHLWRKDVSEISLAEVQNKFVDILRGNFGGLYNEMQEAGLTPHNVATEISSDPKTQLRFEKVRREALESMKDFWLSMGPATMVHLQEMATMKAIYGGNSFPHPESDFCSNIALYVDTIILPDPLLNGLSIGETATSSKANYIMVKNCLTAMRYADLALAELDIPIAVFVPNYSFLTDRARDFVQQCAKLDFPGHAEKIFGTKFNSFDQVINFFDAAPDTETLIQAITSPERFVFDVDAPLNPFDQARCMLGEIRKNMRTSPSPSESLLLFHGIFGRLIQSNAVVANADLYGGVPLIDAPTSWQYYLWKLENPTGGGINSRTEQLAVQHALHAELKDFPLLQGISNDKLIALRKDGLLADLRSTITAGIHQVEHAGVRDITNVAGQVAGNLSNAVSSARKELEKLKVDTRKLTLRSAGGVAAAGLSIGAAATGSVPLGIIAALAGAMGAKSVKDILKEGSDVVQRWQEKSRSPVGMLWLQ